MSKRCIFCQNKGPFSKEHIIPQWLLKSLNVPHKPTQFVRTSFLGLKKNSRFLNLYNLTNKSVCSKCNNGWMSEMENHIKTKYSGLLLNNEVITQKTINDSINMSSDPVFQRWIFKISALYNISTNYDVFVTDMHFNLIYTNTLPVNFFIRLGFGKSNQDIEFIQSRPTGIVYNKSLSTNLISTIGSFSFSINFKNIFLNILMIKTPYQSYLESGNGIQVYPKRRMLEMKTADNLFDFHMKVLPKIEN